MKARDIKIGHVYYVDFEPVRKGEFGKHHIGLVLKKTVNEITFITVPLTSNSDIRNKIKLDITELLPKHLQSKETYAVFDQIRTLNASRFSNLAEDGKIINVEVPNSVIDEVLEAIIKNLTSDIEVQRHNTILDKCKIEK